MDTGNTLQIRGLGVTPVKSKCTFRGEQGLDTGLRWFTKNVPFEESHSFVII